MENTANTTALDVLDVSEPTPERTELLALREEKKRSGLKKIAREELLARGIKGDFAKYLVGETEALTRVNVNEFEAHFERVLSDEISQRVERLKPSGDAYVPILRSRGVRIL